VLLAAERQRVVEYCRRLGASGLTPGTSGNISVRNTAEQLVAISPSSMDYGLLGPADVVVLDLEGTVVDGGRRPSTEFEMHLGCYRTRDDIGAVVHTHSPRATTLAVLGWDLPAVHYMLGLSGVAAVRCAPYYLFGTPELAAAAVEHMGSGYACLLRNHGVLAAGPDIGHAWGVAEQLEFCAGLYLRARMLGEPQLLDEPQMAEAIAKFADYNTQC
jgi:L-fuculose-phosphate aldolase